MTKNLEHQQIAFMALNKTIKVDENNYTAFISEMDSGHFELILESTDITKKGKIDYQVLLSFDEDGDYDLWYKQNLTNLHFIIELIKPTIEYHLSVTMETLADLEQYESAAIMKKIIIDLQDENITS
jgi:hypothetical protein